MECAFCIQERLLDGKWDRFGTTPEQELEAFCDRHLLELVADFRKWNNDESFAYLSSYKQNMEAIALQRLEEEAQRRGILSGGGN